MPYIIVSVLLIIAILVIVFKISYDKITDCNIKITEGKETINIMLKKKLELILNLANEIEEVSDNKYQDELVMTTEEELDSLELNKKLNNDYNKILEIVVYNAEVVLSDKGTKNLDEAKKLTLELIGVENYFNENATSFNKMLKKFPYNIIGKLKKYRKQGLYENEKKEIFEILKK